MPLDAWYNDPYVSVDRDAVVQPDIVYDLRLVPWAFASDNSFDTIIDCCGIGLVPYRASLRNEFMRVLAPGGTFFGRGLVMKK